MIYGKYFIICLCKFIAVMEVYLNVLHSTLSQHPVDLDDDLFQAFYFSVPWFLTYKVENNGIFLVCSTAPKLVNYSV